MFYLRQIAVYNSRPKSLDGAIALVTGLLNTVFIPRPRGVVSNENVTDKAYETHPSGHANLKFCITDPTPPHFSQPTWIQDKTAVQDSTKSPLIKVGSHELQSNENSFWYHTQKIPVSFYA